MRYGRCSLSMLLALSLVAWSGLANLCWAANAIEQGERLQVINASLTGFRSAKSKIDRCHLCVTAGLSLGVVPDIDGTVGNKKERTDFLPAIPKPKVKLTLGAGFAVEALYVPPIRVLDITPSMAALNLEKVFFIGKQGALRLSAAYSQGKIIAPVTLPNAEDEFSYAITTAMLTFHYQVWKRLHVHAGGGMEALSTTFFVEIDKVELTSEDRSGIFVTGAEWLLSAKTSIGFEQFYKHDILSHFHLSAYYRL